MFRTMATGGDGGEGFWLGVAVGFAIGIVTASVVFGIVIWWAVNIATEGP